METFSTLLALCAGNSPVPGEFPSQRPVTRRFDVFFDLRLNKWLSKQSRSRWFETRSRSLWRHCNVMDAFLKIFIVLKYTPGMIIDANHDQGSVCDNPCTGSFPSVEIARSLPQKRHGCHVNPTMALTHRLKKGWHTVNGVILIPLVTSLELGETKVK